MTGSFAIESSKIIIRNGSRIVSTTDGTLVNLLPSTNDYNSTINVVFPDFTKDYLYTYSHVFDYTSLGNSVAQDSACSTHVTVPAQEWSDTTTLAAAPSGADIFVAMVRINRTSSPSHSWGGSPIDVLPKVNEWLPFSGSVLVEAELGMARAFSLYLSGGNLVLHRQQSVSTPPGGFGSWGTTYDWVTPSDGSGGENLYGSAQGIPVAQIDLQNVSPLIYSPATNPTVPPRDSRTYPGGSNACSTSLSTNFGSTYNVEIVGKYGRRS